jgi:hypothetical protein
LVSKDLGKTYYREGGTQILYGAYFFVGENMYEDSRTVFGLLAFLSEFGGMQGLIVILVELIAASFNDV